MSAIELVVQVRREGEAPRTVTLEGAEAVFGKHAGCDVVLADASVSRRHARLWIEGDGIWIEDLGSTNGTYVGGEAVSGRTAVAGDREIEIGPFFLRARRAERAPAPAPPPPPAVGDGVAATALAGETTAAFRVAPPPPAAGVTKPGAGGFYGPLTEFFVDDSVSEVMVNGPDEVFVERGGRLELTAVRFASGDELGDLILDIARRAGRAVDARRPILDARLPDGSRANAILPPLALRGPCLTIRRFPSRRLSPEELVERGAMSRPMLEFLAAAVGGRLSVLVSGGTGTGKTTLLAALCSWIGPEERVITIEDAAELRLPKPHVVPLEARPPDVDGRGEVTIRELVRNALRMRPDRIIVGEVRGGEALDMLQAMNTGHEGSLSTVHANSAREALARLETLVLFAGTELPTRAIREQISSAVPLLVHVARTREGRRRVTSIVELTGMEGDRFTLGEIFRFEDPPGGTPKFVATGYVPRCRDRLVERGRRVDNAWFQPG